MPTTSKPIEVAIGAALPNGIRFISQHPVADEAQPFAVELPGTIWRCTDSQASIATIYPRARIVVPGAQPVRAARLSAAITDTATLARAGERMLAAIGTGAPMAFALRLTAKLTAGAVLDAAAEAGGKGCGCAGKGYGGGCGEASFPGAIAIGLAAEAEQPLTWSEPIGARIFARYDGALIFGGSDKATCVPAGENCSETWTLWPATTTCTGMVCNWPETCKCGDDANHKPMTSCDGWVRCNCNP